MSEVVISVETLGKCYRIAHQRERYTALRDVMANRFKRLFTKPQFASRNSQALEDFWALRDVSFQVKRGEVVGIIGRNGAGKSTLLKILSRITEPTEGEVRLKGRVASLLEVGTGFHPELTGRENIFLNGAILGMHRAEIKRKFDEIVAFSEVEKFLDTPVKRYSSGMYVRLAFAVAAHLEPEILIVDEVLAVGDAQFQKKCLGKMQTVSQQEGHTVLFVSHNMGAVRSLCNTCLLLRDGHLVKKYADTEEAIYSYLNSGIQEQEYKKAKEVETEVFKLQSYRLLKVDGREVIGPVSNDQDILVEISFVLKRVDPAFNIGYALYDENGNLFFWSISTDTPEEEWPSLTMGSNTVRGRIPAHTLNEGQYQVRLLASLHHVEWIANPALDGVALPLTISGGLSDSPYWYDKRPGLMAPILGWERLKQSMDEPLQ